MFLMQAVINYLDFIQKSVIYTFDNYRSAIILIIRLQQISIVITCQVQVAQQGASWGKAEEEQGGGVLPGKYQFYPSLGGTLFFFFGGGQPFFYAGTDWGLPRVWRCHCQVSIFAVAVYDSPIILLSLWARHVSLGMFFFCPQPSFSCTDDSSTEIDRYSTMQ